MTYLNDMSITSFLHPHLLESEEVVRWANGQGHPRKGIVVICIIMLSMFLLAALLVAFSVVYGLAMAQGVAGAVIGGALCPIIMVIAALPSAIVYFLFRRQYIVVLTDSRLMVLRFTGKLKSKEVVAFKLRRLPPITIANETKNKDIFFKAHNFSRIISLSLTPCDNATHAQAFLDELMKYVENAETARLSAQNDRASGQIVSDTDIKAARTPSDQNVAESESLTDDRRETSSKKSCLVNGCGWLLFIPSLLFFTLLILGIVVEGINKGEVAIAVFSLLLSSLPVIIGIGLIYKGRKMKRAVCLQVDPATFQQGKTKDAKGRKYLLIMSVLFFYLSLPPLVCVHTGPT